MMSDPKSFSAGTDEFLDGVRCYHNHAGRVRFPPHWPEDLEARLGTDETTHDWFSRICDKFGATAPSNFAVEENIAIVADIRWHEHRALHYANIQVVISTVSLEDYYLDQDGDAFYLRMDYDDSTLGTPFSHPHPHIHCEGSLSPRFSLDGGTSGDVIVEFLDFLYRHYKPSVWRDWAERTWYAAPGSLPRGDENDPLPRLFEAFRSGNIDFLRKQADTLTRLKLILRREKASLHNLEANSVDRELLGY